MDVGVLVGGVREGVAEQLGRLQRHLDNVLVYLRTGSSNRVEVENEDVHAVPIT
jgi:hypothetical protein